MFSSENRFHQTLILQLEEKQKNEVNIINPIRMDLEARSIKNIFDRFQK